MSEEVLAGGNVNTEVVRIKNTVRRSTSLISPAAHRLLLHLESQGFEGCPKFLGIDDKNREILSFLEGETGIPEYIWQDDQAVVATR